MNPPATLIPLPDDLHTRPPAEQLAWFDTHRDRLAPQTETVWDRYYMNTLDHRGQCCLSCEQDGEQFTNTCCCKGVPL